MVDTNTSVQGAQVPATEPSSSASTPQTTPQVEGAKESALTEERIRQLIAEATVEAVGKGRDIGRRELQSQQDRNKAEFNRLSRRAQTTEQAYATAKTRLQASDPEAARELELAELQAELRGRDTSEQEEAVQKQQEEFHNNFLSTQTQLIKDAGLDPADKRIDWAEDAENYLVAMRRIQGSVSKIQKENTQVLQSGFEKRLKDLEAKINQVNVEANSVDTGASPGAPAGSDAEFIQKFARGEVPMTKANMDRYNKIYSS